MFPRKTKRSNGLVEYNVNVHTRELALLHMETARFDRLDRIMSLVPGRVIYDFKVVDGKYLDHAWIHDHLNTR